MRHLVLFAKRPRLGKVKTRLVPALTPASALALYRAFLGDQLRFLRALGSPTRCIELCLDGPWDPAVDGDATFDGLAVTLQGEGDLGARMLRSFRRGHDRGASAVVIVGADAPTLPAAHVEKAFDALRAGASVVVAPAEDGGYVLIGSREPRPELFRSVPWGGADVFETTRRRAAENGLPLTVLESWYDVDDAAALRRLRLDLGDPSARARAPATARLLDALDSPDASVV